MLLELVCSLAKLGFTTSSFTADSTSRFWTIIFIGFSSDSGYFYLILGHFHLILGHFYLILWHFHLILGHFHLILGILSFSNLHIVNSVDVEVSDTFILLSSPDMKKVPGTHNKSSKPIFNFSLGDILVICCFFLP